MDTIAARGVDSDKRATRRWMSGLLTLATLMAVSGCNPRSDEPGDESALDTEETATATGALTGVHTYQWWTLKRQAWNVDQTLLPSIVGNATYFAVGGTFNNSQGWYGGLQQKEDASRTVHFAIWDADSAVAGSGASCSNFSGEGVGKKCWLPYSWSTGSSYTFRIWRLETDAVGQWWGAWLITSGGTEKYIGKIRAKKAAALINTSLYNFDEYWLSGSVSTCSAVPDSQVYVYWPLIDNGEGGNTRGSTSKGTCGGAVQEATRTKLTLGL